MNEPTTPLRAQPGAGVLGRGPRGLHSSPRAYLTFHRALLAGGTLDGVKILDGSTVDDMFTNQIGDLNFPEFIATADPASTEAFAAGPDHKWGYGLLINTHDMPGRRKAGTGAWAGLLNTHFWIDHTPGITGGIYTQFLPFVTPEAMKMYNDFETAIYASL